MYEQVKLLASELAIGENSQNQICPFCNGGATREESFNIKRTGEGLLYICYRAGCAKHGFVPTIGRIFTNAYIKRRNPNPYSRPLRRLNARERRFFIQKYRLRSSLITEFKFSNPDQRVAMPIADYRGYTIGWNLRYYPELAMRAKEKPRKAIVYWNHTDIPTLHFECPHEPLRSVVLVEDQLSAKRISKFHNSVALMGCNLTEANAQHLLDLGIQNVYVALDQDAWAKSQKMRQKISLFFKTFKVLTWKSELDPKDMDDNELNEIFSV